MGQKVLLSIINLRLKLLRKLHYRYVVWTLRGVEASWTYCLLLGSLLQLYLEGNTPTFPHHLLRYFEDNGMRQQPPPVEFDRQ